MCRVIRCNCHASIVFPSTMSRCDAERSKPPRKKPSSSPDPRKILIRQSSSHLHGHKPSVIKNTPSSMQWWPSHHASRRLAFGTNSTWLICAESLSSSACPTQGQRGSCLGLVLPTSFAFKSYGQDVPQPNVICRLRYACTCRLPVQNLTSTHPRPGCVEIACFIL